MDRLERVVPFGFVRSEPLRLRSAATELYQMKSELFGNRPAIESLEINDATPTVVGFAEAEEVHGKSHIVLTVSVYSIWSREKLATRMNVLESWRTRQIGGLRLLAVMEKHLHGHRRRRTQVWELGIGRRGEEPVATVGQPQNLLNRGWIFRIGEAPCWTRSVYPQRSCHDTYIGNDAVSTVKTNWF